MTTITGKVVNSNNEPLSGASVSSQKFGAGNTTTNSQGNFTIQISSSNIVFGLSIFKEDYNIGTIHYPFPTIVVLTLKND